MRNAKMDSLDLLVGRWDLTLSDAFFLEPPGTEVRGRATGSWIGEAFVLLAVELGEGRQTFVLGRSDANDAYAAFYHDDRGVNRVFAMEFDGASWTLLREDPDFHQRWVSEIMPDRIAGRWEASEDAGATWRKDFDLVFERRSEQEAEER